MPATTNLSPNVQPYADNGTNYQSNNPDFIQRDDNGNIIINQGQSNNQNLVLETIALRYDNQSVVNNIDTRFKYFKFPAENIAVPDISFEGFGVDDLVNPLPTEKALSENWVAAVIPGTPTIYGGTGLPRGITFDNTVLGPVQDPPSAFTITEEIKNSGIDLRFAGRINHAYRASAGSGTIYFTIIKSDFLTGDTDRYYRFLPIPAGVITVPADPNIDDSYVYDFNEVIVNSDFNVGDRFGLAAGAGQYLPDQAEHVIKQFGTKWYITDASLPFDPQAIINPSFTGTSSNINVINGTTSLTNVTTFPAEISGTIEVNSNPFDVIIDIQAGTPSANCNSQNVGLIVDVVINGQNYAYNLAQGESQQNTITVNTNTIAQANIFWSIQLTGGCDVSNSSVSISLA